MKPYEQNGIITEFNMCLNWKSQDHWAKATHQIGPVFGLMHNHLSSCSVNIALSHNDMSVIR